MTQTIDIDQIYSLAELGFRIHPLSSKNKVPLLPDWPQRATTSKSTITKWAKQFKDANWGLATGLQSGVFVVDIDPKNGGTHTWAALLNGSAIPKTLEVVTGSRGTHLYFRYPTNLAVSNSSIGKGVDIRGESGNIVLPPSIHSNGNTYLWKKNHAPDKVKIAKAPAWLLKKIKEVTVQDFPSLIGTKIDKGERNNTIYHQSLLLARQGALFEFTLATMKSWVKETKEFDLSDREVIATVESAFKYFDTEKSKTKKLVEVELSDTGNVQRLLNDYKDDVKYATGLGFHVWDTRRWEYDDESRKIKQLAIGSMDKLRDETAEHLQGKSGQDASPLLRIYKWAIGSHNAARLSAIVELSRTYPEIYKQSDELDNEETAYLLNFNNGTLDLRTGDLTPHDKNQYITRLIPIDYSAKAKCPTWLKTLELAFGRDQDLIDYFQRAVGYSISADMSEQCFFICWGADGNNGKSTMLEALHTALGGDYAMMSDTRVISSREKDNHVLSSLALLNKVRIVAVNEFSETAILDEELIKQLTGGDTVQAKRLYMPPFTFKPVFKIWVRANAKPIVHGTGNAFWRRVKLIPFEHAIPEKYRESRTVIDSKLKSEASGILAWAVAGFQDWYQNGGLRDPQKVLMASAAYRKESDTVNQFWDECVEAVSSIEIPRSILYATFRDWSQTQGVKYVMTSDKFTRRVAQRLEQFDRTRNTTGIAVWKGITLNKYAITNFGGGF